MYIKVSEILFKGKQNIPWNKVRDYMRRFVGKVFVVKEYGDEIKFNSESASEFTGSVYSERLRGGLAKTKANISQIIPELIIEATNRRWLENKNEKHKGDASLGWNRYDVYFTVPVYNEEDQSVRWNYYRATLIVRINEKGLFFHDIINIKKEARTPGGSC